MLVVFSLGALLMRGIGCTVNDMLDRDIDKHVERTRFRPLTSGQLSMKQAVAFLFAQLAGVRLAAVGFINAYEPLAGAGGAALRLHLPLLQARHLLAAGRCWACASTGAC